MADPELTWLVGGGKGERDGGKTERERKRKKERERERQSWTPKYLNPLKF